ncbi:MAG: alpha/beta fold hydrolase [Prevotellaceae bacterium]|jgi:pimeloyl-ACP methyl ester carboxylesterase|nr:alpha/beta fold hydrolase [Prevotellaceae bacterium]
MKKILFVLLAVSLFACKSNKKEQTELEFGYQEKEIKPETYYSEDVRFTNEKEGFSLAGTLTLPSSEGVFPAVVLISGSGAQNRNEEIMGHKPFLVLADHLTRNGIAVLRFDDRGFGESEGYNPDATTENFADDVEAAVNYLLSRNEIDKTKIGLIGHSEGGVIAPMLAAKSNDIAFIVLLAGSGIQGKDLLLLQTALISKAMGASDSAVEQSSAVNKQLYEIVCTVDDSKQREEKATDILKQYLSEIPTALKGDKTDEELIAGMIKDIKIPWVVYFLRYNPAPTLENVKCPVLALNGSKDLQVPSQVNLDAIKTALAKGGNKDFTVKEIEGLNHLFQECNTGSPAEYAIIKQTFSPAVLDEISEWILDRVK